jgi:hypothetical protein
VLMLLQARVSSTEPEMESNSETFLRDKYPSGRLKIYVLFVESWVLKESVKSRYQQKWRLTLLIPSARLRSLW